MIWVLIIIGALILDRLSKVWVMDSLVAHPITVINNFFYLRHLQNKGAAFSILGGKTLFLVIFTSIIIVALIYYLIKYKEKFLRLSLALIIGGALGNLFDRIFNHGSVIDFIEFHFGSYAFPTFNIADSFVVVGTILLAIYVIFIYKDKSETGE
jgi:signal peptidase II